MKNKIFLMLTMILMFSCLFVISASAEVTTYDDAPARTNIQVSTDDVVVFDDGFSCPTGYVFKDISTIGNGKWGSPTLPGCFDFTYINGKTGKSYAFANIVELDLPQGLTSIGTYLAHKVTTLKKVSIPDSVTSFGGCAFEEATNLEECTFEHNENSALTTLPTYTFCKTALKAFSMPDCITTIAGESCFSNCKSLTAIYLSKNLQRIEGGTQHKATFDACEVMYFVNEPFTYDAIPEKPSVYYFPANLEFFSNQNLFRWCYQLNDVLVFGTKMTELQNRYLFEKSPANTVVFLGDMVNVSAQNWGTTKLIFANKADLSASNIATLTGSQTKVYCNAADNTEHLYLVNETLEADCENNAKTQTSCFCGKVGESVEQPGTALGHDNDYLNGKATLVAIAYADLSKDGTKTVKCGVCGKDSELTAKKVIDYKGYSKNDKGAMCMGYNIDQEALKEYESKNSKLSFGFVASANNNAPLEANGDKKENVVKADLTGSSYNAVDFILTADDWTAENVASAEISINLYVIVNNAVKYITASGYSDTAEAKKYSDIP